MTFRQVVDCLTFSWLERYKEIKEKNIDIVLNRFSYDLVTLVINSVVLFVYIVLTELSFIFFVTLSS